MKPVKNRLTPFLIILLIVLLWILFAVVMYKLNSKVKDDITKLNIKDDLVMELYSYNQDEDIILFSQNKYDLNTLPSDYIFKRATRTMTIEDVEINKNNFIITYDSLDAAIKTSFGPDFNYDIKDINSVVKSDLEINDKKVIFNIKYDSNSNNYVGTYTLDNNIDEVKVYKKLVEATKDDYVNLKIGYVFYKENDSINICNDYNCTSIVKTIDSLDDYNFENYITVSLKKASDEVYYYYKSSSN